MKADEDIPQAKDLAPTPDLIIEAVCDYYQINLKDLYKSKRGEFTEAINVAVFLMRRLRHDSLKEIGSHFQMGKYSSISSIIERMEKQLFEDRNLKNVWKNCPPKFSRVKCRLDPPDLPITYVSHWQSLLLCRRGARQK